jgi:hypothetical protein
LTLDIAANDFKIIGELLGSASRSELMGKSLTSSFIASNSDSDSDSRLSSPALTINSGMYMISITYQNTLIIHLVHSKVWGGILLSEMRHKHLKPEHMRDSLTSFSFCRYT